MLRSCLSLLRVVGRREAASTALPRLTNSARCFGGVLPGTRPIPINDLATGSKYSPEEAAIRCKLASLYRLIDARGWSMGIYNHITARINSRDEEFLVNPFGLLYDEVTASNLVKVDLAGGVIDQGSSPAGVNLAGYVLHSAIHEKRPDILCALHVHLPDAIAVATMECGLLPITQEALIVHGFAGVSYHDYQGILVHEAEKKDIQENLGEKNKVLILRNHGVVVCGASVEEAYLMLDFFMIACKSQVAMMAAGEDKLVEVGSIAFENMLKMKQEEKGVDTSRIREGKAAAFGQQDFEACMRKLDRAGYNTGYPYQSPELLHGQ